LNDNKIAALYIITSKTKNIIALVLKIHPRERLEKNRINYDY